MPVDIYVGVERQDDGDWLDPTNHGSCRLLKDTSDSNKLEEMSSQEWMKEFCDQLMIQSWVHPSAKKTQRCL